ncbi:tyrosine-type recombinase/integrase [Macrococcus sp. DPC7161]|uniref:tyrosine-type recombinase/integrase n=1 Tax=Macrococcus sp. DPC7161 TaxID=2507060 RepID=UPI00100AEC81|nr:tyrosine-type recombinase/integrase [Macrococcus sp. DPC7161]RXK17391.1 hypothetical protein ER639_10425 [Macrococcus sp. DPC7161]
MNKSYPIKDLDRLNDYKSYFKSKSTRDYLLFMIALNVPLKVKDILLLTPRDLVMKDAQFIFFVNDFKIRLNVSDSALLSDYIQPLSEDEYLFQSSRTKAPLSRQQFNRILSAAAKQLESPYTLCPNALKKTFAYHAYVQGIHIMDIQHILGHQSKLETFAFIDVLPESKRDIQLNL